VHSRERRSTYGHAIARPRDAKSQDHNQSQQPLAFASRDDSITNEMANPLTYTTTMHQTRRRQIGRVCSLATKHLANSAATHLASLPERFLGTHLLELGAAQRFIERAANEPTALLPGRVDHLGDSPDDRAASQLDVQQCFRMHRLR